MSENCQFLVKKTESSATIPTRGSPDAAGYDLYACLTDNFKTKYEHSNFFSNIIPDNNDEKINNKMETDFSKCYIPKRSRLMIPTGISMAISSGYYARIAPRSGLALKHGIDVGAGVVDSDYRGQVQVILFNHTDEPFFVAPGDRIAQLIITKIETPEIEEITGDLPETLRGADGFGSTGKN